MTKKRRLSDLYVKGAELTVGDGHGEITVWVQKPNPVQQEAILRTANAARAKVTAAMKDKNSLDYLQAIDEINDAWPTRDDQVIYLVEVEAGTQKAKIEAEIEADEDRPWSEDGYLQGLVDAWDGGLMDEYFSDEPTEESKRVFEEMKAFSDEVDKALDGVRQAKRKDLDQLSDQKILDLVLEKHLDHQGTQAWFQAYRRAQILFAVREIEDRGKLYFVDHKEVEELAPEVLRAIIEKLEEISIDPIEGKD